VRIILRVLLGWLSVIGLVGALWARELPASNPVIRVAGGEIVGRMWEDGSGATFRGIPYARPPVGDLRWREPMPVEPWKGQRTAFEFAAACAQVNGGWNAAAAQSGKEDCLYLNVDTPVLRPKALQPVMVWIHGGANAGGNTDELSSGKSLCRHGVVLVTIQYRLGLLGFMAHPELTQESPHHSSGDYGLLDQLAALKWVHENIAQFGGDPNRITIFGQSAGSFDVGLLLASPLSEGLFVGAIEQSGPAFSWRPTPSLTAAEAEGITVAEKLEAPKNGAIAFLRKIPAEEFIRNAQPPYGKGGATPNVDGYFLKADTATVYSNHSEQKLPLIVGSNGREFPGPKDPQELKLAVEKAFGKNSERALAVYGLGETPGPASDPRYGSTADQFTTDTMFRCGSVATAMEHSVAAPTYQYEDTHPLPGAEANGAFHGAELGYLFGTLFMPETKAQFQRWGLNIGGLTDNDRTFSELLQTYWTNFAKTGNPNGTSVPIWPAYNVEHKWYVEFTNNGPEVKNDLRGDVCRLLNSAESAGNRAH